MTAREVYSRLQAVARSQNRPTDEILALYGLERFLARLNETPYAADFCLKGGVLLSAHGLRRPTRDVDMQTLDFELDVAHLTDVVKTVADVDTADGLVIAAVASKIEQIRDEDEYSGLRVTLPAKLHRANLMIKLDVSTGDPIWPAPEGIELPALLGGSVALRGHPLVTVIAEKTVTMLQRGTTSTRWRDLLDVAALSTLHEFEAVELQEAVNRVAEYRAVELRSLEAVLRGYGDGGRQARWAAWRRKQRVEYLCHENLDNQVERVVEFIEPAFTGSVGRLDRWDPATRKWGNAPKV